MSILVSSYKGTYLTIRTSPSRPHLTLIISQRLHLQIPSQWRLEIQCRSGDGQMGAKRETHSAHITALQTLRGIN